MAHPTPDVLALVALGEDVDAEVLEHVGGCRTCFAEIDALQQVVVLGRSLGPDDQLSTPHPRVWQQIVSEVSGGGQVVPLRGSVGLLERPEPDVDVASAAGSTDAGADELTARRRRTAPGRRRWSTVAVAAAAALVVGLGGGYVLKGLTEPASDVTTTQLNALPGYPGVSGQATVEDGANGQRTLVVSMDMPADVSVDGTLAVWMSDTRARDMVPMGTMTGDSGSFPVPADFDLATHPIVDVSLEPPGDTDPAHSDVSVVRGRLNV